MRSNEIRESNFKELKYNGAGCCFYDGVVSIFSVSAKFMNIRMCVIISLKMQD